ncbi:MAG TPA: hypothetical protein VK459_03715, partial [Polyangiaceae bacterium]|nr:hypothetical protein [Polyangiaceae bacterium]
MADQPSNRAMTVARDKIAKLEEKTAKLNKALRDKTNRKAETIRSVGGAFLAMGSGTAVAALKAMIRPRLP